MKKGAKCNELVPDPDENAGGGGIGVGISRRSQLQQWNAAMFFKLFSTANQINDIKNRQIDVEAKFNRKKLNQAIALSQWAAMAPAVCCWLAPASKKDSNRHCSVNWN